MMIRRTGILGILVILLTGLMAVPVKADSVIDSIPAAMTHAFDGRDLRIGRVLARTSSYTRYAITYRSGQFRISGIMNLPRGKGPFPVIVLAHGYIDPEEYVTGQGFRREQDSLARNGYAALHVDYRNHAGSSNDPNNDVSLRLGYAEDVINAALAVRESGLASLDGSRIGLLGRSMGGSVAFNALVMRPGTFDAVVTYASTSTNPIDSFNRWQRSDPRLREAIFARYGNPDIDQTRWARATSSNYFDRITEPVLMFHGTRDESCPIDWARRTKRALDAAGVDATLIEYPGAPHYMYSEWPDSMRRALAFFKAQL
jgi:dipeptidyl aminopeptidase/acylaminoacyl peptidase